MHCNEIVIICMYCTAQQLKEELMTVCGPLPWMRYPLQRLEHLRVLFVLKNRDRYFAGFRDDGTINILPDCDTIADGCFVQTWRRGGDRKNNNFLAHPLLPRGPRKIEITVPADSHAYTVGTHHDGVDRPCRRVWRRQTVKRCLRLARAVRACPWPGCRKGSVIECARVGRRETNSINLILIISQQ